MTYSAVNHLPDKGVFQNMYVEEGSKRFALCLLYDGESEKVGGNWKLGGNVMIVRKKSHWKVCAMVCVDLESHPVCISCFQDKVPEMNIYLSSALPRTPNTS